MLTRIAIEALTRSVKSADSWEIYGGTYVASSDFAAMMRPARRRVLRMLVTGGPPVRGGGGMPHRIMLNSRPALVLRITGAG